MLWFPFTTMNGDSYTTGLLSLIPPKSLNVSFPYIWWKLVVKIAWSTTFAFYILHTHSTFVLAISFLSPNSQIEYSSKLPWPLAKKNGSYFITSKVFPFLQNIIRTWGEYRPLRTSPVPIATFYIPVQKQNARIILVFSLP